MSDTSFGLGLGAGLPTERLVDLELTNAGGQGLLYRATDSVLDRPVAVKVLTGSDKRETVPAHIGAQARMSWHRHVMTVFDAGITADGYAYVIMEYLEGGSCEQLRKRGPVAHDRAIVLAEQLGDALRAAHERHILHCDVKPANVLLDAEGNVRLGDFGSSRELDRSSTTLDDVQGSLMYLAPEILEGVRPSEASDVYSYALTFWTLLTGELPWGESGTLGEAIAVRLHSTRLDFSAIADRPRLRKLFEAATDTDPDRRPLLPALLEELREAVPAEHGAPPPPSRGRRALPWVVGVAALAVGALIGYVAHPSVQTPVAVGDTKVATQAQFCDAFAKARSEHLAAVNHLTSTITEANPSYGDIKAMIVDYPKAFAAAYEPAMEVAAARPDLAATAQTITEQGLENLALVDGMYRFQYDEGLVDTSTFAVSTHAELATSVYDTANAYGTVARTAERQCATPDLDLHNADLTKAMTSAVDSMRGHLVAGSLTEFFSDPRSLDLLDAGQVDLILSSAPGLFTQVFAAQTPWMIEVLEQHPEIRHLLFAQHLPEFIGFLNGRPDLIPEVIAQHPTWSAEARSRFVELGKDQQATLTAQYGPTLHALGILSSVGGTGG